MPSHTAILDHLRRPGWKVSVFTVNGVTEMHAVLLRDPDQVHIARCNDGTGEEEDYRAACLLAQAVGVGRRAGAMDGGALPLGARRRVRPAKVNWPAQERGGQGLEKEGVFAAFFVLAASV